MPPPGGRFPPELTLNRLKLLLNPTLSSSSSIVDSLDNDFENLFFEELLDPPPPSSEVVSPPPPRDDRPLLDESSDPPPDKAPKVMALMTAAAIILCVDSVREQSEREEWFCY